MITGTFAGRSILRSSSLGGLSLSLDESFFSEAAALLASFLLSDVRFDLAGIVSCTCCAEMGGGAAYWPHSFLPPATRSEKHSPRDLSLSGSTKTHKVRTSFSH